MAEPRRSFIPAAGHDLLLPLYDPLQALFGGDRARRLLVDQAALRPGQRVLDIGCGTGSLVVLVAKLHPEVEVVGIDPDPKALARSRRKCDRAGVSVQLDRGFADALPYADACFDRVLSSLVLHHLKGEEKASALKEARRVTRPGGSLHVLDFGGAHSRRDGVVARLLHSSETIRDNYEGRIPILMGDAGFVDASEIAHRATLFGRLAFYRARVPGEAGAPGPARA